MPAMQGPERNRRKRASNSVWIMLFAATVLFSCLVYSNYSTGTAVHGSALDQPKIQIHTLFDQGVIESEGVRKLLPGDFAVPDHAVLVRLSINQEVNAWFTSEMVSTLTSLSQKLPDIGNWQWPANARVNAVLVDPDGRIRVMYSNSPETYFGPGRLPLASTAKIFVAIGLGQYDNAQQRYCIPDTVTSWITVDAARSARCPAGASTISARTAFARSLPAPLLWRSNQVLSDAALKRVFNEMGIAVDAYPSLKNAVILGHVQARPIEMHRAVHAVTLALTGRNSDARMPSIINAIETKSGSGGEAVEVPVEQPAVSSESYRSAITPISALYLREVLNAPISSGTLRALSSMNLPESGVDFIWGKTGTYAVKGETRNIWIVGGLDAGRGPYSWLLLINSDDERHSFGNTNAAAFAPIAKLLIEAAVRDSVSETTKAVDLAIE
jgi:membrane peptidoglycan carboxypeptidase